MCGLAINIASFAHLLKRVDFDAMVDHLAITHIIVTLSMMIEHHNIMTLCLCCIMLNNDMGMQSY